MPIFKALSERAEQALGRVERARDHYLTLYSRALEAGTERLDDLLKWGDAVSPRLRVLLEGRVEQLQHHLDDLNQSLAQRAVPVDRKARVGRLSLDTKARQAGQPGLRVVAGTSTNRSGEVEAAARQTQTQKPTQKPAPERKPKNSGKAARKTTGKPKVAGSAESRGKSVSGTKPVKTRGKPAGSRKSTATGSRSADTEKKPSPRSRKPASPKS